MIPSDLTDMEGNGEWAGLQDWPLIGIHAMVLPDGQILTFGTNELGMQGGQFIYDIWDPITGIHTTLPNTTGTDVFCSQIALDTYLDFALMVGGDNRINGEPNQSIFDVTAYDYQTQTIFEAPEGDLNTARWYPGMVTLGSGDIVTVGGREDRYAPGGTQGNDTLEMYRSGLGWDLLDDTQSDRLGNNKWYYPPVWQKSDGTLVMVEPNSGSGGAYIYSIDVEGEGAMTQIGVLGYPLANQTSSIGHRPDMALILDNNGVLLELDFSGDTPVVEEIADIGSRRLDSDMTILADGRVVITGGSTAFNDLAGAQQTLVIYDPEVGSVTYGEDETLARLYHSTTLLTADGTVLSVGGGAPGPLTNLNAEIWAPDYLFEADGSQADRAEAEMLATTIQPGQAFVIDTDAEEVTRVTAIRSGAVTHGSTADARFVELEFREVANGKLEVFTPENANVFVPGSWMVFVFDEDGVPSVAEMLDVDPGRFAPEAETDAPDPGTISLGNSTYQLGTTNLTWIEARAEAEALGGKIVEIDSEAENDFILGTFGNDVRYHLGFTDEAEEGVWRDQDGNLIGFENWRSSPVSDAQDYAYMATTDGQWDDGRDTSTGFRTDTGWEFRDTLLVIEFEEEPTTPEYTYAFGTSGYVLGTSNLEWDQARAEALASGGRIVEVDSAAENAFLQETFGNDVRFYLGFSDAAEEGTWVGEDGNALVYENWRSSPNGESQDYAYMATADGLWDDGRLTSTGFRTDAGWEYRDTLLVIEYENAREQIAQTGSVTFSTDSPDDWTRVNFATAMDDAVVVVGPPTGNGSDPGVIRVRDVDATGFWVQFDEWDYLDGVHAVETVEWLAVERGTHVLSDGAVIEAGVSTVAGTADVGLSADFGFGGPVVLGQVVSVNDPNAVTERIYGVDADGFTVRLRAQETGNTPGAEDFNWIAFEAGNHNDFSAFVDGSSIDDAGVTIDTIRASAEDVFLADMQSLAGVDTAALRLTSALGSAPSLRVEEEQSSDVETGHVLEDLAWVYVDDSIFV